MHSGTHTRIELVVADLDNTLYNWVDFYVPSFLAMLREIQRISGGVDERLPSPGEWEKESFRK